MVKRGCVILIVCLLFLQSVAFSVSAAEYNLTYDGNGNLIQGVDQYYEYNDFNELERVREDNSTGRIVVEYLYDQDGERLKKKEFFSDGTNQTTYYISENFVQIRNESGVYNYTYYYDELDLVAEKSPDGEMKYYHPDHLGSTTLITNESGDVVEETFYLPYGEVVEGGDSRYGYTSKEKDTETGLNYYGARYYDSYLRHFTQPDQEIKDIYNPQDLNRYSYTRNNPYKYIDPTGENPVLVVAGIAVAVGVITGAITYYQTGDFGKSVIAGEIGAIATLASVGLVYVAGTSATAGGIIYTGIEGVGKGTAVLTGLASIGGFESATSQILVGSKDFNEISYGEIGVGAGINMLSRFTPSTLKVGQDFPSQIGVPFLKESGLQIGSNIGIDLAGEKLNDIVNQPINAETKNEDNLNIKISIQEDEEKDDD